MKKVNMYSATKEVLIFAKYMEKIGIRPKEKPEKVVKELCEKLPIHEN